MSRRYLPLLLVILLTGLTSALPQPTTKLNGHTFTLPPGFTIELVVPPTLCARPITAAFDEKGRLYVAESSGSNEPVKLQLQKRPHRILRLEDRNGDGVFDHSTVFAENMMLPEGTMWRDGSLYVASPPTIWKLTDTNDDGVADQREEWFAGKTLNGCANDLHGPYAAPDGWIYWCKGAFEQQRYGDFTTRAAHIFRARPDGTGIEPVMTGGMDNPVDTVFLPTGERFFTTTFLVHPSGGQRDGIIHAVYGGVYGKDHDVLTGHRRTRPQLMPVLSHLGPAAPAGLHRLETSTWGTEFENNLFACQFNLHKVSRHILHREGAGFRSEDVEFLTSDQIDFHPTDVIEDADGSLLVVDTGGWYKLCCPTSQFIKVDVLGGIYRIRKTDATRTTDPRGLKVNIEEMPAAKLGAYLTDPRPVVRERTLMRLAKLGAIALPMKIEGDVFARQRWTWAATRMPEPAARAFVRTMLADDDESTRLIALHAISLHRDREAQAGVIAQLVSPSLAVRRAAAEALGRIGSPNAVAALLNAIRGPRDEFLHHSVTYALIEMGHTQSLGKAIADEDPAVRRAVWFALDQLRSPLLISAPVLAALDSADPALREVAWHLVAHHAEWGQDLVRYFDQHPPEPRVFVEQMSRISGAPAIQSLLADRVRNYSRNPAMAKLAIEAMAASTLRDTPEAWVLALVTALESPPLQVDCLAALRQLPGMKYPPAALRSALLKVAQSNQPMPIRWAAYSALPGTTGAIPDDIFAGIIEAIPRDVAPITRALAVDILARAELTAPQLRTLTTAMESISPLDLERLLEPFARSQDADIGLALVATLQRSPVRSALREETFQPRIKQYPAKVQQAAQALFMQLLADRNAQLAKMDAYQAKLPTGDVRRGQAVFHGTKGACISCHAMGYVGGKVGPDLTRIGGIRTARDMLEAILYPSASFVRSYEPVQVSTDSGKVYNGLLKLQDTREVVLTLGPTQDVRIPRGEIDEMIPGKVSVMPAGLDQQLSPQELADLLAFLQASR